MFNRARQDFDFLVTWLDLPRYVINITSLNLRTHQDFEFLVIWLALQRCVINITSLHYRTCQDFEFLVTWLALQKCVINITLLTKSSQDFKLPWVPGGHKKGLWEWIPSSWAIKEVQCFLCSSITWQDRYLFMF